MVLDSSVYVLLFFCGTIVLFLIALWIGLRIKIFINEREYLDREIMRSHGELKEHYIKRKKQCWKIFFPFLEYTIH